MFVVLEDRDGGDYGVIDTKPLKVVTSKEAAELEVLLQEGEERMRLAQQYRDNYPNDYWIKINYTEQQFVEQWARHVKFYYVEVPSDVNPYIIEYNKVSEPAHYNAVDFSILTSLLDDEYKGRS